MTASWRWIFLVSVPIAPATLVVAVLVAPDPRYNTETRIPDLLGDLARLRRYTSKLPAGLVAATGGIVLGVGAMLIGALLSADHDYAADVLPGWMLCGAGSACGRPPSSGRRERLGRNHLLTSPGRGERFGRASALLGPGGPSA